MPMVHHWQFWIMTTQKPAASVAPKPPVQTARAEATAELGCVDWYLYPQPALDDAGIECQGR